MILGWNLSFLEVIILKVVRIISLNLKNKGQREAEIFLMIKSTYNYHNSQKTGLANKLRVIKNRDKISGFKIKHIYPTRIRVG
jgi:hypothetical protein